MKVRPSSITFASAPYLDVHGWFVTGDPLPPPSGECWPDWLAHDDWSCATRRALSPDEFLRKFGDDYEPFDPTKAAS